jgi:hypothetical protein
VLMTAIQKRLLPARASKQTEQITEEQARCPHPPGSQRTYGNKSGSWTRCNACKLRLSYKDKTKKAPEDIATRVQQIETEGGPPTASEKRAAGPKKKSDSKNSASELKASLDENALGIEDWRLLEMEAQRAIQAQSGPSTEQMTTVHQGGETMEILKEMKRIQEEQSKAMMMLATAVQSLSSAAAAASAATSSSAPAAAMVPMDSAGSWDVDDSNEIEDLL